MLGVPNPHTTYVRAHFSWQFVAHLAFLLMFCDPGRAGIVVYEGGTPVAEFPDIELQNTQIIRNSIEGLLAVANPIHACVNISKPPNLIIPLKWFVLISEGSCNFETKVLNAKSAGYSVAIIYTYRGRVESSSHHHFSDIPAVVIKTEYGLILKENYSYTVSTLYRILIFPNNSLNIVTFLIFFSIVAGLFLVIMLAFTVMRFCQQSHAVHNGCLSSQHLRQLQITTFKRGDRYETCAVCLEDYKDQDKLRILPCSHAYHVKCIDPWLTNNRRICPVCKRKVVLIGESSNIMGSHFETETETTPLLQAGRVTPHGTFSCVNNPVANPNLTVGQTAAENVQSTSGAAIPPGRDYDGQHVLSFLQL